MTEKELILIELLADKATPGPWFAGYWSGQCHKDHGIGRMRHPGPPECVYDYTKNEESDHFIRYVGAPNKVQLIGGDDYGPILSGYDAAFIAATREAVPALIAEVRRLQGLLKEQAR